MTKRIIKHIISRRACRLVAKESLEHVKETMRKYQIQIKVIEINLKKPC